ncbi:MAG: carbohydrate ABC transporter permease [Clostridia bacterium]|jgi:ABC-type glycerol-3-phosphate transport system permease component|nr:carbohydrate ABC transporter permease [Clostridia bacterium]MBQ5612804.1 carbohydrate ABC transporter permease [Clostridia bacterium]MBQ5662060.1 carbohydrate ABC transporter permease [Clostridia bacterium]
MAKLRTRKHKVVLSRSVGGDTGITILLTLLGIFMVLPMVYVISQSLKPLDELWMYPPRFLVKNPTPNNFRDLFRLMNDSWVPFSRYIFNTVLNAVGGTFGHLFLASMAAYALAKIKFPGSKLIFETIRTSLMFHSTVTAITSFMIMAAFKMIDTYWAIIIPAWGSTLGLYLMKQFMDTHVHDSVLESARLDGASELRTYWTIAMPMVKPAWLTLIVYSFQGLWNAGSSIYIYSEQYKSFNYAIGQITAGGIKRAGASAAATVLMMLVPIMVFVITQSNIIETMGSSGMKD